MRLIDGDALADSLRESKNKLKEILDGERCEMEYRICEGQMITFIEAILRVNETPTVDAVPIDDVAEMLAELFGDECCCNYNDIDEWLPSLCEYSETCPKPIEKNGCWKQLIKHWKERRCEA